VLVDPEDHVAVADAAISLLRDHERARALGAAASERASGLGWPRIATRVEDLLLDLVKDKQRPGPRPARRHG
jgi:glycosyltransferase involved in cell wall biosynthesis